MMSAYTIELGTGTPYATLQLLSKQLFNVPYRFQITNTLELQHIAAIEAAAGYIMDTSFVWLIVPK